MVTFPLKISTLSTKFRAKIFILFEFTIAAMISSYPFFSIGLKDWNGTIYCLITNSQMYDIFSWVVLQGGNLLVSGLIVAIFTTLILIGTYKANKKHHQMTGHNSTSSSQNRKREAQLTHTLVVVAILFLVLRLPFVITYYVSEFRSDLFKQLGLWAQFVVYAINAVANVLAVLNYSINFFLYCLCGSAFRQELMQMCGYHTRCHHVAGIKKTNAISRSTHSIYTTQTGISSKESGLTQE